jgi:hypothetical protein
VDPSDDILAQADGPGLVDLARATGGTAASREVLERATHLVPGEPLRAARYALAAAFIGAEGRTPAESARQLERRVKASCGDLGETLVEVDNIVDPAEREAPLATVLARLAIGDPPEATRHLAKLKRAADRDRVLAVLVEATHGVFLAQKIADEALRAGSLANIGEWEEAELVVGEITTAAARAAAHQRIAAAARASGDDARARKHEALADGARGGISDDGELATAMREAASIAGGEIAEALLARAATLDSSAAAARDGKLRRARLSVAFGDFDHAVDVETIVDVFPELARARYVRDVADLAVAGDAIAWAEARSTSVIEATSTAVPAKVVPLRRSSDALDGSWDEGPGPSTERQDLDRGKPPWSADPITAQNEIKPAPVISVAPAAPAPQGSPPPGDFGSDDEAEATSIMGSEERRALQLAARTGDAAIVREVAERIAFERDLEQRRLAVLTEGYDTARRIAVVPNLDGPSEEASVLRAAELAPALPSVIGPPMEGTSDDVTRRAPVTVPPPPVDVKPKRSALSVIGIVALVAAAAIIVAFYARMLGGHH